MEITKNELRRRQFLPLSDKIEMSQCVIETWWKHWDEHVYVAFSGGKDSCVLLHLVRSIFPDVEAVFSDTGLEYPEVKNVVKSTQNVTIVRPRMSYTQVIKKYGYPVVSKKVSRFISDIRNSSQKNKNTINLRMTGFNRNGEYLSSMILPKKWIRLIDAPFPISDKCCEILKKSPLNNFSKESGKYPYSGQMASDSNSRERIYLRNGCSIFDTVHPICNPLGFWTEQDILQYILKYNIKIPSVYGNIVDNGDRLFLSGVHRTGCIWCMFGSHLEREPNRFQQLEISHPKIYNYCMNDLGLKPVLDYLKIKYTNTQQSLF